MKHYQEIPVLSSVNGWKEHPLVSRKEEMVQLDNFHSSKIMLSPQYFLQGIPFATREMYVRKNVKEKLFIASSKLPKGYSLVVWDAWRPYQVQETLFQNYLNLFKTQFPLLTEKELKAYTETYVSLPSKVSTSPSPHSTGGAVDVTIADCHGVPLNMGSHFDDMSPVSATRYFEEKTFLTKEEEGILWNRRLLFFVMCSAGFTNYHEEWWHYDFGNQFWGIITKKPAIYNGIPLQYEKK